MKKPAYKIKIGSTIFDSSVSQDIISISADMDLDVPSDSFRIALKTGEKAGAIKNGDAAVIEMGYEGALNKVLTGSVDSVEPGISEVVISGLGPVSLLTGMRVNQVYEKQTAGAIVKDIAGRAGIAVKDLEEGLSFPMYVLDDTKDAYAHLKDLALKCGCDIFMTNDGRLNFKKYKRQNPKPFKYGRDILEVEVNTPTPAATCVKVCGESPSSFKGAETAHWGSKKVVEGIAGSGTQIFLYEDPLIKDKDTADKVAASLLEVLMSPLSGALKCLGNTGVGLGDTIEIKDMPDPRMSGEFEITGVSHTFNQSEGLVSLVSWVKKISITPAAPPLAEPPPLPAPPRPPSPLEEELEKAKGELEEQRMKLVDAVEIGEMNLEKSLVDINSAMSGLDKLAREMIAAAEEVRKTAVEAASEAISKADELKKELEAKKKEIEEGISEAKGKFDEMKKDALAQMDGFDEEMTRLQDEAQKAADEAKGRVEEEKKKADEQMKGLEEEAEKAAGKVEEGKRKAEDKQKELEAAREEAQGKEGEEKEKAKERVKELEASAGEAKEKAESMEKEVQERKKKAQDAEAEARKKEEVIEKEVEAKKKEVDDKIKEVQAKKDEVKKAVEDIEKEMEAKVEGPRKKLKESTKEVEAQVDEAKKTADSIRKEADEKFEMATKSAEDAKREATAALEMVKKVYNEARDTVIEARKMAGME